MAKFLSSALKVIFRLSFVILALVGFGFVAFQLIQTYRPPPFNEEVLKTYMSPDNRFKAVQFFYSGGGALAPYCFSRIAIVDASLADAAAADKKFQVFWGECDRAPAPTLTWIEDRLARIDVSSDSSALQDNKFQVLGSDITHTRLVEVVFHP